MIKIKSNQNVKIDSSESYDSRGFGNPNYIYDKEKNAWRSNPAAKESKMQKLISNCIEKLANEASADIIDGSVYSLDDYKGEESKDNIILLKKFIDVFPTLDRQIIFYFYGPNRSQKTTVALAIGYEILRKYLPNANLITGSCVRVKYIRMTDLLDIYFNKYNRRDTTPEERFQNDKKFIEIMRADLLIVDEAFDKEKAYIGRNETQNVLNFFDSFKHHIIFISNVEIDNIDPVFGGNAIKSRLRELPEGSSLYFNDVLNSNNNPARFTLWNIFEPREKKIEEKTEEPVKVRVRKRKED